jgi:Tfp pilus assembly protein PilN
MTQTLHQLASQAEQLHAALKDAADAMQQYEYNLTGIQRCADDIARCMRMVGNDRTAALSARDTRKVMDEMQRAVDELMELLNT